MRTRKLWTSDEIAVLKSEYPDCTAKELCDKLGRTTASVYGNAKLLGLEKSEAFKKSEKSGRGNVIGNEAT